MSGFRKGDVISFSDFILIAVATIVLLTVTYFLLKKVRPYFLKYAVANPQQKIKVIENRNIPRLGQTTIISVDHQEFLVVQTKTGVCIAPLENGEKDKINFTSPQC